MDTKKAVNAFLDSRKARGLSPHTVRWYAGILKSFARKFPRVPNRPEKIEAFLGACRAGDERRHGYYRAVRCFYRFLHRRFDMRDPMSKVDAPKRKRKYPEALTPDELEQLLAYPHQPAIKTALLFLADTGARVGELAGLTPKNLTETPWGHVAKINDGKTGARLVPISPETHRALTEHLPFEYSPYRLRRLISRAFTDAHVRGSASILRHTFGTLWEGEELILQHILGHAHLSTTLIYRHMRTKRLSEQHNKHSPLTMIFSFTKRMGF